MTKMFTVLKIATPWVGRSKSTSCGAHAWCFEWCFWKNSSNRLTSKISKGLPLYWTIDHSHFFWLGAATLLPSFLRELESLTPWAGDQRSAIATTRISAWKDWGAGVRGVFHPNLNVLMVMVLIEQSPISSAFLRHLTVLGSQIIDFHRSLQVG